MELELHAGLTVPQNAQRYYEKAKEMARKASGAKEALIITKQLKGGKGRAQEDPSGFLLQEEEAQVV